MYNYYQQPNSVSPINPRPTVVPTQQYIGLRGHPVSSLEEAKAATIEFDGSIFYFPDIANKRIYTKTTNLDGTASFNMYELKPLPPAPIEGDYITRPEFEQALARISELLAVVKAPPTESQQPPQSIKEVF